jgi:carboxylate-amine ligase
LSAPEPAFTIGIEEEYLLVDRETRDLAEDPPPEILAECERRFEGQMSPEFMRAQIESGTKVCSTIGEAREQLADLRRTVAEVAGQYGLAPVAASTHPFADWDLQHRTDKERYKLLAEEVQAPARRLLICGMHTHVGIEDSQLRIDLLSQAAYFLPHLLALSTSSPFWRGRDTGLKSYRIAVFDELPRTGLPEHFESYAEYERHLNILVRTGIIEDGTKIWWDIRPSARFPTLEMRICDMCTRLDDTVAIASFFRCILRMLFRLRRSNQRWRRYSAMLINENRWRAQRYGTDGGLIDFGREALVPYPDLLEELIELVGEDAAYFGCEAEIAHARRIVEDGTSAHRQLVVYHKALAAGGDRPAALRAVVDHLVAETVDF